MRMILVGLLCLGADALGRSKKHSNPDKHDAPGVVVLNGERTSVVWTDGDSFNIKEGLYKGHGTRLVGYNTLEAFGPVHRWGEWTPRELYELAKGSSQVAAAKEWACSTDGSLDGYKRVLINCPELAVEMVRAGHGMAYAPDGSKPDPKVVAAQAEAMKARRGMWEKGVVNGVITSLHSVGEDGRPDDEPAYNRVADTRTGEAHKRKHSKKYATCEEVCETTDGDRSCMTYVPFQQRYRNKPDCLR